MSNYEYDKDGIFFQIFLCAILCLILLPYTYLALGGKKNDKNQLFICGCQQCAQAHDLRENALKKNRPKFNVKMLLIPVGWLVVAFLINKIVTTEIAPHETLFDPFAIMELNHDATKSEIKKKYKELQLFWHSDKNAERGRITDEQIAHANDMFIKISKAYKVLTDDDAKKIWEEWGNPDGRQAYSFGIALPSWIVDSKYSYFLLTLYIALFGLGLPIIVGKWWSARKDFTKDGIYNATMSMFVQELRESFSPKKLIEVVCASVEFKLMIPWRGKSDNDAVLSLFKSVKELINEKTGERIDLPTRYNSSYVYKTYAIILAHIFRVPITDEFLKEDAQKILPLFANLSLKGLFNVAQAHHWFNISAFALDIHRMTLQAVPCLWSHTESNELYQLPYLNAAMIKTLRQRKKTVKTIASFNEIELSERKKALSDMGLTEVQTNHVVNAARSFPRVKIEACYFECVGEDMITCESLVTFVVRLRAINTTDEDDYLKDHSHNELLDVINSPKPNEIDKSVDAEDDDGVEIDENGEKVSKLTRILSGYYWDNVSTPVHCPYFPQTNLEIRRPGYYVFLSNPRNNRVIGCSKIIDLIPSSLTKENKHSVRTVRLKFQAPDQSGTFPFHCIVMSDSYIAMDHREDVKLSVKELPKNVKEARQKEEDEMWKDLDKDLEDKELSLKNAFVPAQASYSDSSDSDSSDSE